MTYYNYHAIAMNLIKSNHCIRAELKEKHNQISPALVLYFNNHPPMPIQFNSFERYFEVLNLYNIPITSFLDNK